MYQIIFKSSENPVLKKISQALGFAVTGKNSKHRKNHTDHGFYSLLIFTIIRMSIARHSISSIVISYEIA
jgi:hypothetical protein